MVDNIFDVSGKVIFITGAGSGLGRDAARGYAQRGASVVLADVAQDRIEALEEELNSQGHPALAVQTDVSLEDSVRNAFEQAHKRFGRVDVVLNDAGICPSDSVENFSEAEWNQVIGVNINGIRNTTKYVLPEFKERGYGKIVNIASVCAVLFDSSERFVKDSYYVTKSAVVGFTKDLAARYAKYGINVNAVGPGLYKSNMTDEFYNNPNRIAAAAAGNPSGRVSQPGDLNGAILFLSTKASDYVQGQVIYVDGGSSLL